MQESRSLLSFCLRLKPGGQSLWEQKRAQKEWESYYPAWQLNTLDRNVVYEASPSFIYRYPCIKGRNLIRICRFHILCYESSSACLYIKGRVQQFMVLSKPLSCSFLPCHLAEGL